jgi:4-diphosphocytidyl-2-C-methyl-D-erythritol kinase
VGIEAFTGEKVWPSPAKLNLFLHVTGQRSDGYHTLQTVFQLLDWGDSLQFRLRDDGQIKVHCNVAIPENDLCSRAARALQGACPDKGVHKGVDILLHKKIPMGAGLGGGSSNAATTLLALNELWGLHWPLEWLAKIGLALGADVPVFVHQQSAWAEGVGEVLKPFPLPEQAFVVLVPACHVDTGLIFRHPDLPRNHARITPEDYRAGRTQNDCQALTAALFPPVAAALAFLGDGARMSGTGSSVFLPCESYESALHWQQKATAAGFFAFVALGR